MNEVDELRELFRVDKWYVRKSLTPDVPFDICKDGYGTVQVSYQYHAAMLVTYELAIRDSRDEIAALKNSIKALRHDLATSQGLWCVDHQLENEPDAFQLTHPSLRADQQPADAPSAGENE